MLLEFLKDYLPIILFLFIALVLSAGFIVVNFLFSPNNPDPEKLSAYECGFEPFNDSRIFIDIEKMEKRQMKQHILGPNRFGQLLWYQHSQQF